MERRCGIMSRGGRREAAALAFWLVLLTPPVQARCERHSLPPGSENDRIELLLDGEYLPSLLAAIAAARSEIVLSAFLFRTTAAGDRPPDGVLAALQAAVARGVDVRVVLEQGPEGDAVGRDNRETAMRLRDGRVTVCLDEATRTSHGKVVVIDRRILFLGSHNLTTSALQYNREVSVRIESPPLAREVLRYLRGICP